MAEWMTKELAAKMIEALKKRDKEYKLDKKLAYVGGKIDARPYIEKDMIYGAEIRKLINRLTKKYVRNLIKSTAEVAKKAGKKEITVDIIKNAQKQGKVDTKEIIAKIEKKMLTQQSKKIQRIAKLQARIDKIKTA